MTDALDLDALEAAERAATPGPWDHVPFQVADGDFILILRNAARALFAAARRAQQDASREGTHAPDCHLWGRRHYDCLLSKYEASRAEVARLREALEAADETLNYLDG